MFKKTAKVASAIAAVCMAFGLVLAGSATEVKAAGTSTSYNFSNTEFKSLGTINSTKTVGGLTFVATSSKTMKVASNKATVDGYSFKYALSLGGTGDKYGRAVRVPVTGASTIKVTLKSGGSDTRKLTVATSGGNTLTTMDATSTAATKSYNYTGNSGYILLYSKNSNINLYKIQVDTASTSGSASGSASGSTSGSTSGSASGSASGSSTTISGTTIEVKAGGTSLADAIKKAKSGNTIVINGTVKSGAINVPAGVNIAGKNNATIDFSQTSGSSGRGLTFAGNGSKVSDITVTKASDNGIFVSGSNNTFTNVTCTANEDAGFQVSNGGAYNKFYSCNSHHNADAKGENADGFANKLHSGEGNYYENCRAEYNSDDGWDCYAAHGAVTLVNCHANYNGYCNGIYGDGNGFKMGGVDNKTPGVAAHMDPLKHQLIGCEAKGNYATGFDRNNQNGVVTMKNCVADSNKKYNYGWPKDGTPSALGKKVTFGTAQIIDCTSKNGKNNITGAQLSGNCVGF